MTRGITITARLFPRTVVNFLNCLMVNKPFYKNEKIIYTFLSE